MPAEEAEVPPALALWEGDARGVELDFTPQMPRRSLALAPLTPNCGKAPGSPQERPGPGLTRPAQGNNNQRADLASAKRSRVLATPFLVWEQKKMGD